jgi:3-oxoacyl-[acyl-carrier-protein] synthase II
VIWQKQAILGVYLKNAYDLNISGTKIMTGHCLGAAGARSTQHILAVTKDVIPPLLLIILQMIELDLN